MASFSGRVCVERTACCTGRATCLAPVAARPRCGGRRTSPICASFGAAMPMANDPVQTISQLASAAAVVAGAWLLLRNPPADNNMNEGRGREACPRCGGSKLEACFCTRWSDGDTSGCSACNHTGRMPCRSCGGSGTAIPVLVRVQKLPDGSSQQSMRTTRLRPQRGQLIDMDVSSSAAAPQPAAL